jgi:hypothetical protein
LVWLLQDLPLRCSFPGPLNLKRVVQALILRPESLMDVRAETAMAEKVVRIVSGKDEEIVIL